MLSKLSKAKTIIKANELFLSPQRFCFSRKLGNVKQTSIREAQDRKELDQMLEQDKE